MPIPQELFFLVVRMGKMLISLLVIFSCRVGVPPAQELDDKECQQEVYSREAIQRCTSQSNLSIHSV